MNIIQFLKGTTWGVSKHLTSAFYKAFIRSVTDIISLHAVSPINWQMTRQIMMSSACIRGDKRIDPRLRKQKRLIKSTNAGYGPFVPIKLENLSVNKICVISRLAKRYKALVIL